MWNICGYKLKSGEKRQGYLYISTGNVKKGCRLLEKRLAHLQVSPGAEGMPVTLICGAKPGKTLLVTAGVHGDEYPGIAAAVRLAGSLDPDKLQGNVMVCHCVNVSGFWNLSRYVDGISEKNSNLNDNFPGDPGGTKGEQIAAYFVKEIFPFVDFILDLHSGSVMEPLTSCLFFPGHRNLTGSRIRDNAGVEEPEPDTVRARSLAAARALDIPYLIESRASGGLYSYAACHCGIPGLLIENGHSGYCEEAWVNSDLQNIGRLLKHLEMYAPESGSPLAFAQEKTAEPEQMVCTEAVYLEAEEQALWYPAIRENMEVKKGQLLGHTEDFFGNRRQDFYAQRDGRVFYYCSGLAVSCGRLLVAYGIRMQVNQQM